jgi:hypothetical protein
MRGLVLCAFLLMLSSRALQAEENQQPWTLTAYFENDLFADTDQSYTNGVRFSWISPDISSYEHDPRLPPFVRKINDRLHFFHDMNARDCGDSTAVQSNCLQRNLVISVGQLMFTPVDAQATEVVEDYLARHQTASLEAIQDHLEVHGLGEIMETHGKTALWLARKSRCAIIKAT